MKVNINIDLPDPLSCDGCPFCYDSISCDLLEHLIIEYEFKYGADLEVAAVIRPSICITTFGK